MTLVLFFVFGTIVGSFLNVCIFRLPRNKSIIFPRSHCIYCGKQLKIWDLVPLLSYLFLRGRCRYCGHSISWRYPLVELLTGTIFAGLFWGQGGGMDFAFFTFLFCVLAVIFFIDLEFQVIPDILVYLGIGAGLVYNLINGQIISSSIGMLLGFSSMWLLRRVASYLYKQEALGQGDVWFAALMGAVLGWQNLFLALFISFIIGSIIGLALLILRRAGLRSAIPFGPMLVLGTVIVILKP